MANLNIQSVIAANPKVQRDIHTMEEALSVIKRLRAKGIEGKTYDLASPFERHRSTEARPIVVHSTD
ncbi:hypothetical protein [Cribrihabitans neustonicus]|uniref:hypothetical protein n=1 Tax=Cribrihabitans neustonicus TaxID=1429085 RepID=UPI003B58ECD2